MNTTKFTKKLKKLHRKISRGFTLTEVLIALPVASIVALGLVMVMFTQYGDLQKTISRTSLVLEAETALTSLEDELLFSTDFGESIDSDLSDFYSPTGGWTHDTSPQTLIVYERALTADKNDINSDIVYKDELGCSSTLNPFAINNLVYFTQDNIDNNYKSLMRRTIVPQYATCNTNYRSQTCPIANVGTNGCVGADNIISDKVVDFKIDYFDEEDVLIPLTGDVWSAEKIKVSLILGQKTYGEDIQVESSITMKKVN